MNEINEINKIVLTDVPKVLENEQIYVYIPVAVGDKPGLIAIPADSNDFVVENGYLKLKWNIEEKLKNYVPRRSQPNIVYTTDSAGNDSAITFSLDALPGVIAKRTDNGDLIVLDAPVDEHGAVNKKYVDKRDNELDAAIKVKLDISRTPGIVYANTDDGVLSEPTQIPYSSAPNIDGESIVSRTYDGYFDVKDPLQDTHAANRKYADRIFNDGGTIKKNLNVLGDLKVQGNLIYVSGTIEGVEKQFVELNTNKKLIIGQSGLLINKGITATGDLGTYAVVYDADKDAVVCGLGTTRVDKIDGKDVLVFEFNEGEGLPLTIRSNSEQLNNNHLVKWNSEINGIIDAEKSIDDLVQVQPFSNPSAGTPYEDEVAYNVYALDKDKNTSVIPVSANRHSGNTLVLRLNDGRIFASDAIDPHNVTTKVQVENRMNALSPDLRDELKTYIYFKGTKFPSSNNSKFTLPVGMEIDWGDGRSQNITNATELLSHTYTDKTDTHIITIFGTTLTEIPNQWLKECTGILSMYVSKYVHSIGDNAFSGIDIQGELVFNGADDVGLTIGASSLLGVCLSGRNQRIIFKNKVNSIGDYALNSNTNGSIVFEYGFVPTLGTGTEVGEVTVPKSYYLNFKAAEQWKDLNIVYKVNSADIPKVSIAKIQDSNSKEFAPDENGVVTIPGARNSKLGLFTSKGYLGLDVFGNEGTYYLVPAGSTEITNRNTNVWKTIQPRNLNFAVKAALTDDKRMGTETSDTNTAFSDTEKDRACEILGATRTNGFKTLFGNQNILGSGNIDVYKHVIHIQRTAGTTGSGVCYIVVYSSNNLQVDSLTDLKTLLGNTFTVPASGYIGFADNTPYPVLWVSEAYITIAKPTDTPTYTTNIPMTNVAIGDVVTTI